MKDTGKRKIYLKRDKTTNVDFYEEDEFTLLHGVTSLRGTFTSLSYNAILWRNVVTLSLTKTVSCRCML